MMRGEVARLNHMKRSIFVVLFFVAAPLSAQQPPEIRFHSVPNFLKLPPDLYLGEATGVAIDSKGHIFVLSRGNTTGPAYAASAAQLLEFYPEGRVVMVFGRKQEASDEGTEPLKHVKPPLPPVDGMFRQVTDVAWDSAGNTYISDGYVNSRIAKVDKDGNWLKSWGEPGDQPGQFNTPHSIAVDAQNNIYVADRGNRRIQVFNSEGKFLRQFTIDVPAPADARPAIGGKPTSTTGTMSPGAPWAICITPGPNQVLYASDAFPGRIYKLSLDGKVLGVLGKSGKQLGQFGWIHEIACPSADELYVAELLNWRIQKLVLEPTH